MASSDYKYKFLYLSFLLPNHKQILEKIYYQVKGLQLYNKNALGLVLHNGLTSELLENNQQLVSIDFRPIQNNFPNVSLSKIKFDIAEKVIEMLQPDIIYFRYVYGVDENWVAFSERHKNIITEHQTKEFEEMSFIGKPKIFLDEELRFGKSFRNNLMAMVSVTPEIAKYQKEFIAGKNIPDFVLSNGINVGSVKKSDKNKDEKIVNCLISAHYRIWHGIDRLISGLIELKNQLPIVFHLAGEGKVLDELKAIISKNNLNEYFKFYGLLSHENIDEIAGHCDVAIGSLGLHRIGLKEASILKNREYCSRGLPFIYSFNDCDFGDDFNYQLKFSPNDFGIDIKAIYDFALSLKQNGSVQQKMRDYAQKHLDWKIKMGTLNDFFIKLLNNSANQNKTSSHQHSQKNLELKYIKKKKIIIIQGGFPSISATFILDQMTGLIDRGFEIENWSTYKIQTQTIHEDIEKYNLLCKTRYINIPPENLRSNPEAWINWF